MNTFTKATYLGAVAAIGMAATAFAQTATPPAAPAMKTIGVASTAKPEIVPSLIVMNSAGATLQGQTLTLTGIAPTAIIFADRPVRSAGHALTRHLIEDWKAGSDSFAKDPPNATISVLGKDGTSVKDAVVTLNAPKLEGDKLIFTVQVLEGDLTGAEGPSSLFIDIIGLPRTPLSFAGVARRTAYRGAFYGAAAGAAVAGAAYAGAAYGYGAPYYAPPAYYPPPPVYYPY